MLAPDANILIYAHNQQAPQFEVASRWLETAFAGDREVGIPFLSVLAFLRIVTNPNLGSFATSMQRALALTDSWLAAPNVRILHPGPAHWKLFRHLCVETGISGRLSTDAHLAALAIEHDATLMTADTDFARFPGLKRENPLTAR